jgi:diguanylate cyclase (GGDEF)-like protein/PAS domain S-box-containing protein
VADLSLDQVREEQKTQNLRFDTAINNMSQGLCFFDGNQRLIVCNDLYARMYKLTRDLVRPGTTLGEIVDHRFAASCFPDMSRAEYLVWRDSIAISPDPSDTVVELKDGRTIAIHHQPMPDGGWVATHDDITERKQAEQALHDSAYELRLLTDNLPVMTVSFDENLRCLFANKPSADFYGFGTADIVGKYLRELVGEDVYSEVEPHFAQVLRGHPVTYQRTRKLENGESGYLEVKLLPRVGHQGKVLGLFAVTTDITEHKLTEERIQRVAHHDSLTGLPNRLLFNDRLFHAISLAKRYSRQIALLYLDLDRFKPVNDALGHTAGDELLKDVATRIRHQVRESDTVARVGGDEFTVILPNISRREEPETVAKKIHAALSTPFQLGSQKQNVSIGTSIGIAVYPADAGDADALVKAADAAMYRAKQVRVSSAEP